MGMKTSYKLIKLLLLCVVLLSIGKASFSQQPIPPQIKKSEKIETIDGKKFYLHAVEKGQTLYSIAKTYGTTVDIVLANNQDAIDGLKAGDKLKIPFSGNTDAIKKEIEKQTSAPVPPKKEIVSRPPAKDTASQKHVSSPEIKKSETFSQPVPKKDS